MPSPPWLWMPRMSPTSAFSAILRLTAVGGLGWQRLARYTPYWLPGFTYSGTISSLESDAHGHLHLAFIAGDISYGQVWYTQKEGADWGPLVEVEAGTVVILTWPSTGMATPTWLTTTATTTMLGLNT